MEARYYIKEGENCRCLLCPHHCLIANGQCGLCRVRRNVNGVLIAESYGRISSLALDPIEKKPLHHFHPGSKILSVGSFGCNMRCAFCQNSSISQTETPSSERDSFRALAEKAATDERDGFRSSVETTGDRERSGTWRPAEKAQSSERDVLFLSPEKLAETAMRVSDNLGLAFTYNEPFIGLEYLLDTVPLIKEAGLKTALITNGMVSMNALEALLPHIDAMNIDLKSFSPEFYRKHSGDLDAVKATIRTCASACHVEITALIILGENDSDGEIRALSEWLAEISVDIPLHLSRFFPRYRMLQGKMPTPRETLYRLADIAARALNHVHIGNI